jgi:hypothetical protein
VHAAHGQKQAFSSRRTGYAAIVHSTPTVHRYTMRFPADDGTDFTPNALP